VAAAKSLWQYLVATGTTQVIVHLLDIALVSAIVYYLLRLLRARQAFALAIGVLLIVAIVPLTTFLPSVNWLVRQATLPGMIALIILFQPELRAMLQRMGRGGLRAQGVFTLRSESRAEVISVIAGAAETLAAERWGALIVIERADLLTEIAARGRRVDAELSRDLLVALFHPGSALHDGAVIVSGDRVAAAACTLPLSEQQSLPPSLGMRHRGALGLSERTDAVVVIVSEESGQISLALGDTLRRDLGVEGLRRALAGALQP
jgi:diadenylate cyclase